MDEEKKDKAPTEDKAKSKSKAKAKAKDKAPAEDKSKSKAKEKAPAKKGKYNGKEIDIKQANGAKFKGQCIGERGTPSGDQVLLKINSTVSRWFNVKDIAE